MLKVFLIALALGLGGFLIYVQRQPAQFNITRSVLIAAPPAKPYALVNDFRNWKKWSPWEKMDPNIQSRYEGPDSGAGSSYAWVGNSKVGQGKMTITESRQDESIQIRLDFVKPMPATNLSAFSFRPEAGGTRVNWSMNGTNNFLQRAICTFMNMDKVVGGQFDKGLADLKMLSEKP